MRSMRRVLATVMAVVLCLGGAPANADPDPDGVIRRAPTYGHYKDRGTLSLVTAAALLATEGRKEVHWREIRLGDVVQPLMVDGSFLVNFRGKPGTYAR